MIVLDASVVIKWFQEEPDASRALNFENAHIRGEENIVAPDLLFYEIANVLCYKNAVSTETAESALEVLSRIGIQTFTFLPIELKDVFRFARDYGVSVYDAIYVVLAQKLHCDFVTADKRLYKKLAKFEFIRFL